jgi:tRNA-splicing ligase RtcB
MNATRVAGAVQVDEYRWMLPREGGMRVPGILFADRPMIEQMMRDRTPEQVRNAAHLPGILPWAGWSPPTRRRA